jgi:O-antigen/teichoic acid export membrane protein
MRGRIKHWFDQQTIRRAFSYSTALVWTQALMVAYTLVLMWWLSPEEFGIIAANYAAVTMLAFIINWGFNEWLVKAVALSETPRALTGSIIRFKLVVGTLWAVALWLILPLIQPAIYIQPLLTIIILDVWLDTSHNLLVADLVGNERVNIASVLLVLSRAIRFLSLLLLVGLGSRSVITISAVRLACSITIFIIGWIITRPQLFHPAGFNSWQIFRKSFAFNAFEVLNLIYSQIDINLLTWLSGDARLIGNYAFVSNVVNMVMTVPSGIYNLLLPKTIKTYKSSKPQYAIRMRQVLGGFILLGFLAWGGGALLGMDWVMRLFGSGYQEGIRLMAMISPVLFLRSVNYFNHVYLVTVGWELKRLIPQAFSVLIKAFAGVWVVLNWQAVGLVRLSIVVDAILLAGFSFLVFKQRKLENESDKA